MTARIPSGSQESGWVGIGTDVDANGLVAVITPSALDSTSLYFLVSHDGGTTSLLHYDSIGQTNPIAIGTDRWISLDPALHAGFNAVKLYVDSAESADRDFILVIKKVA
jgi:hypothetical protein